MLANYYHYPAYGNEKAKKNAFTSAYWGKFADYAKNGENIAIKLMPMTFQYLLSGDIFQYQVFKRTDFDLFKLTLALLVRIGK